MNHTPLPLLITLLLTACAFTAPINQVTPTANPVIPTTSIPTIFPTDTSVVASPTPQPLDPTPVESAVVSPRPEYHLDVVLDYGRKQLAVSQLVVYPNQTGDVLDALVFVVEPLRYKNFLNPGFQLLQLSWDGPDGQLISGASIDETLLHIPLGDGLAPGETVRLFMVYVVDVPNQPGAFGYTDRQMNLNHWFPFVPHYDDGWVTPPPAEVGEYLVYPAADYYVEIFNDDASLVIAGPAPAVPGPDYTQYELLGGRTFAFSVSPDFVELYFQLGDKPVWGYVFPENQAAGEAALETAAKALDIFEFLFGPYPYEDLTMVEIDHYDGLEADGLFFIGKRFFDEYQFAQEDRLHILVVHEISHQWFYSLVGNNPAEEPWLDESITTYAELLYYENVVPESVDWWWAFRIDLYSVYEKVNRPIAGYATFPSYVRGVYVYGAEFFDALRQAVGDEAFFAGLAEYLAVGRHEVMSGDEFLRIMTQSNPDVLQPLLDEFFDPDF